MKTILTLIVSIFSLVFYVVFAQAASVQKDVEFSWDTAVCEGTCVAGVDGYRLYTAAGELVHTTSLTSYLATGYPITVGVDTGFYVTAYNDDGESEASPIAFVRVDGTAPSIGTLRAIFK